MGLLITLLVTAGFLGCVHLAWTYYERKLSEPRVPDEVVAFVGALSELVSVVEEDIASLEKRVWSLERGP